MLNEAASRTRTLGACTVQLPITDPRFETPHGPLLVMLEGWSDGTWIAGLPAAGLGGPLAPFPGPALAGLRDRILEYAAQDAAPDDHAHRALLALEQRVLVTTPEPEGQAAEART